MTQAKEPGKNLGYCLNYVCYSSHTGRSGKQEILEGFQGSQYVQSLQKQKQDVALVAPFAQSIYRTPHSLLRTVKYLKASLSALTP